LSRSASFWAVLNTSWSVRDMPGLRAVACGSASSATLTIRRDLRDVRPDLLEQRHDDAFPLAEQRGEQVERQDLGVVPLLGQLLRPDNGFLCFDW
jgi:hypothetical protein